MACLVKLQMCQPLSPQLQEVMILSLRVQICCTIIKEHIQVMYHHIKTCSISGTKQATSLVSSWVYHFLLLQLDSMVQCSS